MNAQRMDKRGKLPKRAAAPPKQASSPPVEVAAGPLGPEPPVGPSGPCVAGIGASAGGFEAICAFFDAMPADSGIAFVVIQHLPPGQKSLAAELIGKHTKMPVVEAQDGTRVEANHVYTIPPGTYPSIRDCVLHLAAPEADGGLRLSIDHFFRSLGEDRHARAIGIILSGSGSDGALGLKSIAANGGVVLVQRPETAQFDGMPREAIASGLANHILPVEKMPEVLVGYAHHPYVASEALPAGAAVSETAVLDAILELIRGRRGYDFAGYRKPTLLRRIHRRMGLRSIERWSEYAELLRHQPEEIDALFRDLLIGVTEFFRDPEAWQILETEVIAPLVADKPQGEPIRVWMPGTATGEEAYSLAIALLDATRQAGKRCPVQIFATDSNDEALQVSRLGSYPAGIATRMPPERLRRYFSQGPGDHRFQVARELRDCVVFGLQNVVTDPPFSRLDLITCRNLLIYLEPSVQKHLVSLFRFGLRPGGYLFLGSAETLGPYEGLFEAVSKRWRIFRRTMAAQHAPLDLPLSTAGSRPAGPGTAPRRRGAHPVPDLANVAQHLILDRFAPASVLVNGRFETLYFCGPVENYLVRPRGAPTRDLLAQVRNGLRSRLAGALRDAADRQATVEVRDVRVKRNGVFERIGLTVTPAGDDGEGGPLLLVVFQDQPEAIEKPSAASDDSALVQQLEEELRATKHDLLNTIESLENSHQQLKASHEEVVSVNEELQSINEELESSREELQSLNEEMSTVNQRLQNKVAELETVNSDLKNLLASSEIPTICLDPDLRIRWFTPAMSSVFHVIPGDVGRPVGDFAETLSGGALAEDAAAVLEKLAPVQRELCMDSGHWYLRRILPYRGAEDRVQGVVVTFIDITENRRAAEAAVAAQKKMAESLEHRVQERTAQVRAIAAELSLAEERERRGLAQDLHDDLGQVLAIVKLKLSSLSETCGQCIDGRRYKEIEHLVDQANKSVRSLALQLSPPILHTLGLVPALEWLVEEMERVYGLAVRFHDDGEPKPLDEKNRSILFRAVRELLINVAKHARIGHAELTSLCAGGKVLLTVTDEGGGFDHKNTLEAQPGKSGLGLLGMRERLAYIGAEMHVDSRPGDGTTITLMAPLEMPLQQEEARQ